MKNPRHNSRRGFALLLTLIIVSFAAAIAVLFLLSARQERVGTDSYAQGARVRQLADTAVNIVMGQINAATREGTASNPVSWASQPGMIRTYTTSGTLSHAYKLYSWNHMIEASVAGTVTDASAPAFDPMGAAELPPTSSTGTAWNNLPMEYTDLNAPVTVYNGAAATQVYPIMDPTVANPYKGYSYAGSSGTPTSTIPWDFPGEVGYQTDGQGYAPSATNVLPMPVQWLYVLQDGTWIYPNGFTGTTTATFDSTIVTATNPIVGRIAFWTDDETCKVNLNTAGEGAYWDWPKAASQDEMQFAGDPPCKGEFYRIAGHPATTSLSAVFPDLLGNTLSTPSAAYSRWTYSGDGAPNATYLTGLQALLGTYSATPVGIAPRYSVGTPVGNPSFSGSQAGTYPAPYFQIYDPTNTGTSGLFSNGQSWYNVTTYSPISLNTARLYATPDELFFAWPGSPNRTELPALKVGGVFMTQQQVSQRLAFVTTNSRAPETTLFNTPRVSMWPITWPYGNSYYYKDLSAGLVNARAASQPTIGANDNPNNNTLAYLAKTTWGTPATHWITPQEDLIAFCATLNSQATGTPSGGVYTNAPLPYYFQRQVLDSPIADFAGGTSSIAGTYPGIKRNVELANYLRGMISQPVPGLSNSTSDSLEAKWTPTNADWITLNCMDYCRSMVNQNTYDPNSTAGNLLYSYTGAYQFIPPSLVPTLERSAFSAPPLRVSPTDITNALPSSSQNYFRGTPPSNASSASTAITGVESSAYVTNGSFPSLKEVAMEFIATRRLMPFYLGEGAGANTSTSAPTMASSTVAMVSNPFYWINLINPGPAFGGIAPTNTVPDGNANSFALWNKTGTPIGYPVGCRTTQMQGILIFDFSMLRDGVNVAMSPNFWVRVDGLNNVTVKTGAGSTAFCSGAVSTEVRGLGAATGYGRLANCFAGMENKTNAGTSFVPAAAGTNIAGQTQWGACSNPIPALSSDTTFTIGASSSTPLTVSIFAPYPASNAGANLDKDPTNDAGQFITSYKVDFSPWASTTLPNMAAAGAGALPMPIAPRWNVRQAPTVWYPDVLGTGSGDTSTTFGWAASEMVPDVQVIPQWNYNNTFPSTPTYDATAANLRDYQAAPTYSNPATAPATGPCLDLATNNGGTAWMMYAAAYAAGAKLTTLVSPPVDTASGPLATASYTPFFGDMANRIPGQINSPLLQAELQAEGVTQAFGSGTGSLFTTTGFISGSSNASINSNQAMLLITPYDTVISCMVNPNPATSTLPSMQGDPRLTNNLGETAPFIDSYSLLSPMDASGPAPILESGTSAVKSTIAPTLVVGLNAYPRMTFQAQYHELANHGYIGLMTGFHLSPLYNYGEAVPSSPSLSTAGFPGTMRTAHMFGWVGNTAGAGTQGELETLSNGIGLETNAYNIMDPRWDWTSEEGSALDGGFIERPDQDYQNFYVSVNPGSGVNLGTPYFCRLGTANATVSATNPVSNVANFMPNRQIPSPVVLGTIATSMTTGWQTLAFNPNPAATIDGAEASGGTHPGPGVLATATSTQLGAAEAPYTSSVPDHVLLDLFWMPVAEPYPISEQFSTAGKINLNYAMMPFPYIARKTGLDAVMKSVWIYALPDSGSIPQDYKGWYYMGSKNTSPPANGRSATTTRYPISVSETLKAFDYKFYAYGDIFRSASQICDMFLYPAYNPANGPGNGSVSGSFSTSNPTAPIVNWDNTGPDASFASGYKDIMTWWGSGGAGTGFGRLTSTNGRQAPYNAIYSRITTQSNSYTVHWKVQTLHKLTTNGSDPTKWVEGTDRVTSELRGSTLIERYLDPNAGATAANSLPDYANPSVWSWPPSATNATTSAGPFPITYYYKWRVDNETYFQPTP